jgi:hypothetical protein
VPDIYRHEFVGVKTGHTVRLDISPASSTPLGGTPTIEMLDGGVIKEMSDWGWEDKDFIPYGLAGAVNGKLVIKPSIAPADFVSWLLDGIQTVSCDFYTGASTHTVQFDTGTNFVLSIKPAGGAQFSIVGNYVLDITQQVECNTQEDTLTVFVSDVLQHACKVLTFAGETVDGVTSAGILDADWDQAAAGGLDVEVNTGVVEWVWKGGANWFYIAHIPPGYEVDSDAASCFWSTAVANVAVAWNAYVRLIVQKVMRRTINVNITTAIINTLDGLYKQNYTTDALVGSAVPTGSLRFLMFATNNNFVDPSTTRDYSMHDVLSDGYDNFWDFLNDLPRARFKRWCIGHTDDGFYFSGIRHYNPFGRPEAPLDVTSHLRNSKVSVRGDAVVARVEAGTEFHLGEDYTDELSRAPASRNNKTISVPVIFDSSPVIDTFVLASTMKGVPFFESTSQFTRDRLQNTNPAGKGTVDVQGDGTTGPIGNPRFLGVYYRDNPTDGTLGNAFHVQSLIRCHAWQPFVVDGETPTPPASSPITLSSTPNVVNGESNAIASQQIEGTLAQLHAKIFATFYSKNTVKIEASVPFDFGAKLDLVGDESLWLAFTAVIRAFEVDTSLFAAYLGSLPTTYDAVSCKANFQTETLDVILWGRA